MAPLGKFLYLSCMATTPAIPDFALFGEVHGFPDVVHLEPFRDRAAPIGWTIRTHRHSGLAQVLHLTQGAISARLDGAQFQLRPGQVLYVPALAVHAFDFQPDSRGHVLSIPVPIVTALTRQSDDLARRLSLGILTGADAGILGALAQIRAVYGPQDPLRQIRLVTQCQALLAEIGATLPGQAPAPMDERMRRLTAMILDKRAQHWRPNDFAAALGVTAGHLNRLCQAATGMPTSSYIETVLMSEARRLLAFTSDPVSSVGYRLGYADPAYFSRRFRAVCGEAPSSYRQRYSG